MSETPIACLHCESPVPAGSRLGDFCCRGCQAVYGLLREQGLDRYYELAGQKVIPVAEAQGARSYAWLDPLLEKSEQRSGAICAVELDVQGIHCAACVWLMDELFRREPGGASITVNPTLGKLQLAWRRGEFDPRSFVEQVERFGYLFGPSRKRTDETARSLLLRLGFTAALAMNVMLFSVAFYVGLAPDEEGLYRLFTQLSVGLSTAVVLVGGWPFFKAAWLSIKRGLLHLDLPIALGILLVYVSSLQQAREGGDLMYFDTLNVFVTLMLVGRWLQQRVLDRNRLHLLEDGGADGILVRRREGDRLVAVPAPQVAAGDHLVTAPGDLVPVECQALEAGSFSTDWITGEADVQEVPQGGTVQAGSFNAGSGAVLLLAQTSFDDSPLPSLLRTALPSDMGDRPGQIRFWDKLSRIYVVGVLAIAALGLGIWWPIDPAKALQVTAALLVVTCPCALGIAIPLAYELAQARLRRRGLFVKRQGLLDKLTRVRKLLFDKTGTLTLGRLHLLNPESVAGLDPALRDALFDMSARSNHPVSRCLADEVAKRGARFQADAEVEEVPGCGLQLIRGGVAYRLGRGAWALAPMGRVDGLTLQSGSNLAGRSRERGSLGWSTGGSALGSRVRGNDGNDGVDGVEHPDAVALPRGDEGTVFSADGEVVAIFRTEETIRADARSQIAAFRDEGIEVRLLSGDAQPKVSAMAARLGILEAHAHGGLSPEEKASLVEALDDEDTLFLGDGVNDSLAFEAAYAAGTPAVDRPVLPGKADFFLLGEGLGGLGAAFRIAERLSLVVKRLLILALSYNAAVILISLAGWMSPLRAAIIMPISSLVVLAFTVISLGEKQDRKLERAPSPLLEVA